MAGVAGRMNASRVIAAFLGIIIAAFGAVLLVVEMQRPEAHSSHVYLFAGMFGFGCLLIVPSAFSGAVKQIIVVIGPYLPEVRIGGRRKSDPPADGKP